MKKILSILLVAVMLLSFMSLVGCGNDKQLKLGLGTISYVEKITNADADTNGAGETANTFAAVLLNNKGKIVDCVIDAVSYSLAFTSDGKFVTADEFKTKYEQGKDYGMVAYGGAKKEWFEQVDAFTSLVKGKTLQDVKALVATDGKGNDDVVNAGCTIVISDFITAIEKAVNNAQETNATANDTLKLAVVSTQSGSKDATEEAEGVNEVDTTVSAVTVGKDGKVTAIKTDASQTKITFDTKGVSPVTVNAEIKTKLDLGEGYGMAQYGQDLNGDDTVKEWFEQAAEFDKACIGKNADEITKLALNNGYAVDSLQSAGCTINISDMVKAAVKAAK